MIFLHHMLSRYLTVQASYEILLLGLFISWLTMASSSVALVSAAADQSVGGGRDGQTSRNRWDTCRPVAFPAGGEDVATQGTSATTWLFCEDVVCTFLCFSSHIRCLSIKVVIINCWKNTEFSDFSLNASFEPDQSHQEVCKLKKAETYFLNSFI